MPALPCRLLQGCAALLALALWAIGAGRVADPERAALAERPQAVAPFAVALAEVQPASCVVALADAPSAVGARACALDGDGVAPPPRLRMGSARGARAP